MIAYNNTWLRNQFIRQQAGEALENACITPGEDAAIRQAHPDDFYTPNLFIRIGLFLLTIIITLFSFGLLALILSVIIVENLAFMLIFSGLLVYAALEVVISRKLHFRSGVDDALTWMAAILLVAGLSYGFGLPAYGMCLLAAVISGYLALRYADRLMALVAFLSIHGFLFISCRELGGYAEAATPFVIMFSAAASFFLTRRYLNRHELSFYRSCLLLIEVTALLLAYAAINYFIVREISVEFLHLRLRPGTDIPFGLFFKMLTVLIPCCYLFFGIRSKDRVLLDCGLVSMAASIVTFYHYYPVVSIELLLCICGGMLVAIAWLFISYLRQPRNGFVLKPPKIKASLVEANLEALTIAETAHPGEQAGRDTRFGGGSFGGAGAGNDY